MPPRNAPVSVLGLSFALLAASGAAADRPSAPWPPAERPLRVVIDTDAANEIDDQYALALALGKRDRLLIEGFVAAHFGEAGGPAGIEKSYQEIERVLDAAGLNGEIPVKRGVGPLADGGEAPTSDGVEFILERARAASPDDPLWLVLLGPPTDAIAALERDPSVADRLVVFWHVRSEWPKRCRNFNARNDPVATRRVLELPSRLVLFDTGTDLYLAVDESERRYGGIGRLGEYLAAVHRAKYPDEPKAVFDLGDLAALVDPGAARWERTPVPSVDAELNYDFSRTHGEAVRIRAVDRKRSFDLLEEALKRIEAGEARRSEEADR